MQRARTASVGKVPIQAQDLGSSQTSALNFSNPALYDRMRSEVWHLAKQIPVFLVSPPTMDQLCPPQLRKVLDPQCLKDKLPSILREYEEVLLRIIWKYEDDDEYEEEDEEEDEDEYEDDDEYEEEDEDE